MEYQVSGGIRGAGCLWSDRDSFDDLMVIPFVGSDGLVRACQIRFMRYIPNKSGRYVWLSSSKKKTAADRVLLCIIPIPIHAPLSPF